jgi:hypothetical protein
MRSVAAYEPMFERGPVAHAVAEVAGDRWASAERIAIGVLLLGWMPVVLLVGILPADGGFPGLLRDAKFHANFLVAAPVLVVANAVAGRRIAGIIRHFARDGLIPRSQLPRFRADLVHVRNLISAPLVACGVIAAAYLLSLLTVMPYRQTLTGWHMSGGGLSAAGWWHMLVSLPIFAMLVLGWLWRLAIWGWLLARIAALDLSLVPAHPDRAAGLGFVGYSLRALAPIGFAIGIVGAGSVADAILRGTASLTSAIVLAVVLTGAALLLCALPVLAFTPTLIAQWWSSVFAYDDLAFRFAQPFRDRWISGPQRDKGILERPDFSAATDLSQVVGNVHAIRPLPIDAGSAVYFIVATLLPFIAAALLTLPPSVALQHLRSFLV